ncbi:MAG: hydantoinase/oxoprolinase family protein, partial [Acidobacteriota bacterium]
VKALRRAGSTLTRNDVLLGYLVIADQRMAEAVRQISVRRGYDPRSYALVAFGGAGGQHACSVAEQLGIATVILPPEAGLLSAFGLGSAVLERFATRQVLKPLVDVEASIERWLSALGEEARRALSEEAPEGVELETRRRLVFLRLRGQESALEIEALHGLDLKVAFLEAYGSRYGYRPRDPEIEVVSLRAVVSERRREDAPVESGGGQPAAPLTRRDVVFESGTAAAAVHGLEALEHGDGFDGPALVFDSHASLTVPPGWRAEVRGGAIVAERRP